MSNEPKTHPVTFYPEGLKVQTDDHYRMRVSKQFQDVVLTSRLRWSKDGKLQQEVQHLGSSVTEWVDVPQEGE